MIYLIYLFNKITAFVMIIAVNKLNGDYPAASFMYFNLTCTIIHHLTNPCIIQQKESRCSESSGVIKHVV